MLLADVALFPEQASTLAPRVPSYRPVPFPLWVSKLALGGLGVISGSSLHVASVSDRRWNWCELPALSFQLTSRRFGLTVSSQWSTNPW